MRFRPGAVCGVTTVPSGRHIWLFTPLMHHPRRRNSLSFSHSRNIWSGSQQNPQPGARALGPIGIELGYVTGPRFPATGAPNRSASLLIKTSDTIIRSSEDMSKVSLGAGGGGAIVVGTARARISPLPLPSRRNWAACSTSETSHGSVRGWRGSWRRSCVRSWFRKSIWNPDRNSLSLSRRERCLCSSNQAALT